MTWCRATAKWVLEGSAASEGTLASPAAASSPARKKGPGAQPKPKASRTTPKRKVAASGGRVLQMGGPADRGTPLLFDVTEEDGLVLTQMRVTEADQALLCVPPPARRRRHAPGL